ncbi:STM4014 family protein [Spongiactinospora sp. TRM90649]|uniref:STM4014 family protein n=1 Tax=Spongiactinospora sp. TRM90649 TaxID=3031114 RepID=UPI0023F6A9E6|nr:STM4014 family protein [Spongiactinospora sp. TRM90649]MDF5753614.1 STM4014 family protein [Spongiactinospora sp. TRM90649]
MIVAHGAGPPFVVVGTPGDRRVGMFGDALRGHGLAGPLVVPWHDVLAGAAFHIPERAYVRIDSPGEDLAADRLLRGPGAATRVGGGAAWHAGFVRGLERVRRAVARAPGARLLADIDEIAVMFDKRRTHARLTEAGVPVPLALPGPVAGYARLRALMARQGWGRVFVKPAHGSSASGIVALQVQGARVHAVSSVELVRPEAGRVVPELHNSLRVRAYTDEGEVAAIIDALAPDGLHVERWFPKASVGGRVFDLRVVVIGGRPTHAVVRTSRTPMTNLHLGGTRGDLEQVRARLGAEGWEEAMRVCARAAACFPGSVTVGVDLMVGITGRRFAVAEVNAFGDLLPGLMGLPGSGAEGLGCYEAQVAHLFQRAAA